MATPTVIVYHGASEPLRQAYRIIRAAWQRERHVAVRLETPEALRKLDFLLWSVETQLFLPHVALDSPLAADTPILLACAREGGEAWPRRDVLVNLAADVPADAARFQRIFDIVADTAADRETGRVRSRAYRAAGFAVEFKSVAAPSS